MNILETARLLELVRGVRLKVVLGILITRETARLLRSSLHGARRKDVHSLLLTLEFAKSVLKLVLAVKFLVACLNQTTLETVRSVIRLVSDARRKAAVEHLVTREHALTT